MHPLGATGIARLIIGILFGIILGFTLIKMQFGLRKTFLDQMSLKNCLVIKTILFSLAVGVLLFHFAFQLNFVAVQIRPGFFWGAFAGALLTGTGIAVCGYVPVTAVASLAMGRTYAVWTILGMLIAIPGVRVLSYILSNTIYNWPAPFNFHETLDGYFSSRFQLVLWISAAALLLSLFLEFALGSQKEE
jgi:hypothetical protein